MEAKYAEEVRRRGWGLRAGGCWALLRWCWGCRYASLPSCAGLLWPTRQPLCGAPPAAPVQACKLWLASHNRLPARCPARLAADQQVRHARAEPGVCAAAAGEQPRGVPALPQAVPRGGGGAQRARALPLQVRAWLVAGAGPLGTAVRPRCHLPPSQSNPAPCGGCSSCSAGAHPLPLPPAALSTLRTLAACWSSWRATSSGAWSTAWSCAPPPAAWRAWQASAWPSPWSTARPACSWRSSSSMTGAPPWPACLPARLPACPALPLLAARPACLPASCPMPARPCASSHPLRPAAQDAARAGRHARGHRDRGAAAALLHRGGAAAHQPRRARARQRQQRAGGAAARGGGHHAGGAAQVRGRLLRAG
jgi:hypothetical protein